MGTRGPKPKPTDLKKLEGTYRSDRAPDNEPRPKVRVPSAPKWLGPEAKKEWRRVTKELAAVKMISELDRTTLALYCQALQEYLDAQAALDAEMEWKGRARAKRADERMLRKLEKGEGIATEDDPDPFPDSGLTAVSSKGTLIVHPLVHVRNEAWKRVLKAAAEFGMSPSSRTRISIPVAGPDATPANPFLQLVS